MDAPLRWASRPPATTAGAVGPDRLLAGLLPVRLVCLGQRRRTITRSTGARFLASFGSAWLTRQLTVPRRLRATWTSRTFGHVIPRLANAERAEAGDEREKVDWSGDRVAPSALSADG